MSNGFQRVLKLVSKIMQWNDDNKYKMSYCPKLKYTEHFLRMLAIFLDQQHFKCQEKTTNALDILNYFLPTFWNFFKNTNIWSNDMGFEVWTISTSDWSRWYWMIWMFWLVETSSWLALSCLTSSSHYQLRVFLRYEVFC